MNKRENIYSLEGFSKVFKFTVRQTFKNKGYLLSFVIFVLVMTLMGPLQYLGQSAGQGAAEDSMNFNSAEVDVDNIYIYDQLGVIQSSDNVKDLYESRGKDDDKEAGITSDKIHVEDATDASEDSIISGLKKKDVAVVITASETGYKVNGIIADDSDVEIDDLDGITEVIKDDFDTKRFEDNDVKAEDAQMIFSGVNTDGVTSETEYLSKESKAISGQKYMFYMLGFSMIVFIVVSMSASYIITSVTEEKQSKLVESLLVSVRPMALLLGKVCGMMSYVVLLLVCGVIGSNISGYVMENVFNITEEKFSNSGFNFSIFKDFGVVGGVALVLSVILAFLAFGMISGLFGSTCNKTEDMQNATGNVMTISMISYFAAVAAGGMDNDIVNKLIALIPPFSYFAAPVTYVTGRISAPILIVSYVIQIALIVGIVVISAKSYRNLLLSDSTTQKLKTIFKSAKG